MSRHTIEIDDDLFQLLKKHAEPFSDTPNSVLRKLLLPLGQMPLTRNSENDSGGNAVLPVIPKGTPEALRQVLEVSYLVRRGTRSRTDATRYVAGLRGVAPQTVLDKYCRQLGLTAPEFDRLLDQSGATELKRLLLGKFPTYRALISGILE
jgi:hypothetical protein